MNAFLIIGVHRTLREVVVWAGKSGFVPLTRDKEGPVCEAKAVTPDVAEELMKHLTKRSTTTKYEFFLVPVVTATYTGDAKSGAGLILPHMVH